MDPKLVKVTIGCARNHKNIKHKMKKNLCMYFKRAKQPGHEVDHSPPSSVEVKNEWSCTSIPLATFMGWTGTTLRFIMQIQY
jgi:hypothetical protein